MTSTWPAFEPGAPFSRESINLLIEKRKKNPHDFFLQSDCLRKGWRIVLQLFSLACRQFAVSFCLNVCSHVCVFACFFFMFLFLFLCVCVFITTPFLSGSDKFFGYLQAEFFNSFIPTIRMWKISCCFFTHRNMDLSIISLALKHVFIQFQFQIL